MADVSTRYFCTICRRPYHPKYPPRMVQGEIIPCRDCRRGDQDAVQLSHRAAYAVP